MTRAFDAIWRTVRLAALAPGAAPAVAKTFWQSAAAARGDTLVAIMKFSRKRRMAPP